jgi:hypothetical protein
MATPRYRELDIDPKLASTELTNWDGTVYTYPYVEESTVGSMTDYVTEGFREKIRNGDIINNPCVFTKTTVDVGPSASIYSRWETSNPTNIVWKSNTGSMTALYMGIKIPLNEGSFYTGAKLSQDDIDDLVSIAKSKCLAHVDNTPWDFLEDALEIRETLRFLRHPLLALDEVAKSFTKDKRKILWTVKDKKRQAKAIANLWNQYRFAAAPLLRSILNIYEAMTLSDQELRPPRRSAHGYAHKSVEM